MSTSNLELE